MEKKSEPEVRPSACSYCGNAPVNHFFSFLESAVTVPMDNYGQRIIPYVPNFIKKFVDVIPGYFFRALVFFKLAQFSSDIEKARTFRSKIIWQEAEKRGIKMEEVIFLKEPLDYYRALLPQKGKMKWYYFESIPVRPEFLDMRKNWDDKVVLKDELRKHGIPVPNYFELSLFSLFQEKKIKEIFSKLEKPLIVKPRVGSRGRHTVTNIHTIEHMKDGVNVAGSICSHLVVEEHLSGKVCRATIVNGELAGFYSAQAPTLVGDGEKKIRELIADMDRSRDERVEPIRLGKELFAHLARSGCGLDTVLPKGIELPLTHRMGRLFGGRTKEMLDELHPSFVPIFKKAARVTGLPVVGFDSIIPDPTKDAASQRWGVIECNTLPFIDLHYYALLGKPKNIAGMIWDMWANAPQ